MKQTSNVLAQIEHLQLAHVRSSACSFFIQAVIELSIPHLSLLYLSVFIMLLALLSLLLVAVPLASADPTGSILFAEDFDSCITDTRPVIAEFTTPATSVCVQDSTDTRSERYSVSPTKAIRFTNDVNRMGRTLDLLTNAQSLIFEFWLRYGESVPIFHVIICLLTNIHSNTH